LVSGVDEEFYRTKIAAGEVLCRADPAQGVSLVVRALSCGHARPGRADFNPGCHCAPTDHRIGVRLRQIAVSERRGSRRILRWQNHASTRTTQLYDPWRDEVSLDEVERIVI
jgi:hypothetical protein